MAKSCGIREVMIAVTILQLITIMERLVFDFLGYMWVPIIMGVVDTVFVLSGLFAAVQYRKRCAVVYVVWMIIWLSWNIFLICLYLEVGILSLSQPVLDLGLQGSTSWWKVHGIGCNINATSPPIKVLTNEKVTVPSIPLTRGTTVAGVVVGCLVSFTIVEVIHAAVQILLSVICLFASCYWLKDLRLQKLSGMKKGSMEFISMSMGRHSEDLASGTLPDRGGGGSSLGPGSYRGSVPRAGASRDTLFTSADSYSYPRDKKVSSVSTLPSAGNSGPSSHHSRHRSRRKSTDPAPREALPWVTVGVDKTHLNRSTSDYSEPLPAYSLPRSANDHPGSPQPPFVSTNQSEPRLGKSQPSFGPQLTQPYRPVAVVSQRNDSSQQLDDQVFI